MSSAPRLVELLDPLVVTRCSDGGLDAWMDLVATLEESEVLLGTFTYAKLFQLAASSDLLPDLWQALNGFAGRLVDVTEGDIGRHAALCHDGACYGSGGEERAVCLLRQDVACIPDNFGVVVVAERVGESEGSACRDCRDAGVYFRHASDGDGHRFLVDEFRRLGCSFDQIEEFQDFLFPNLLFHERAWQGATKVSTSDDELRELCLTHLSVLDLHGAEIMAIDLPEVRIAEFSALGVVVSPESPKVHRDRKAMSARRFGFPRAEDAGRGEYNVLCEWHSKFFPTDGRVYFGLWQGVVHIGAIRSHL